jgi:hypothetical protein
MKLTPVCKVKVQKEGGNPGITWFAVPLDELEGFPLMRDGEILYVLDSEEDQTRDEE